MTNMICGSCNRVLKNNEFCPDCGPEFPQPAEPTCEHCSRWKGRSCVCGFCGRRWAVIPAATAVEAAAQLSWASFRAEGLGLTSRVVAIEKVRSVLAGEVNDGT